MIAGPAVVATAPAVQPVFAPPLGPVWRYHEVSVRQREDGGTTRVALDQDLSFAAGAGDELIATLVARGVTIAAPAAALPMLHALFDGYQGTPTIGRLAADGRVLGIVDGAATWAAVRKARQAALAALARTPAPAPDELARARALTEELAVPTLDDRDARLAETLAELLPPLLPPLRPGEPRAFTTDVASPAGPLPAIGTATLSLRGADVVQVRVEVRSTPAAAAMATADLAGRLAAAADRAGRASLAAAAAAAAGATFSQTLDATLDRATGLLVASTLRRAAIDAQGTIRELERVEITRTRIR